MVNPDHEYMPFSLKKKPAILFYREKQGQDLPLEKCLMRQKRLNQDFSDYLKVQRVYLFFLEDEENLSKSAQKILKRRNKEKSEEA